MKQDTPYPAPDFSLADSSGQTHSLSDYRSRWLVLYFYPKDDTPGCTTEACSFRDSNEQISALDAAVVGISRDDSKSHTHFAEKHELNFTLLSDEAGEVIKAYGAWGPKMFGNEGILRKTFIINPDGQVVKVYGRVTPVGHGGQVIRELEKLQKA